MHMDDINSFIPDIGYFHYLHRPLDWGIEESVIDFIDISYVVGGKATYYIDGKEYRVSAGDLLCIPKGCLRSSSCASDDMPEIIAANFQLTDLTGTESSMPLPLLSRIGVQTDIVTLYRELNGEWLRREPGYLMKVRAYFLLILQRYFELILYKGGSERSDVRIKAAIRYMTDHFAEPLTIGTVAEIVGLTPVYFGALFKQATGATFRQYLTVIRLNHAENILRQGDRNVNEAARDCGFPDLFYFSRIYKQHKGVPPSQAKR